MSDIFREVDEDIRQEKYRRLWQRFAPFIIGVAVLIVVGTGGYRGWLYWQETQSQSAGDTFLDAVNLSEAGSYAEAGELYAELEKSLGGYPALAKLRQASDLAAAGKQDEALASFDSLSRDSGLPKELRDVAALRAGYLAVDSADFSAISDRVERLSGDTGSFRFSAREILALSSWKNGDIETARKWVAAVENDPQAPLEVSRRVSVLADVIRAQHGEVATGEGAKQ